MFLAHLIFAYCVFFNGTLNQDQLELTIISQELDYQTRELIAGYNPLQIM